LKEEVSLIVFRSFHVFPFVNFVKVIDPQSIAPAARKDAPEEYNIRDEDEHAYRKAPPSHSNRTPTEKWTKKENEDFFSVQ